MAAGRNRADWNRTSHLLALLYNINRDPKKSQAAKPHEMNPYAQAVKEEPIGFITPQQLAQIVCHQSPDT